MNYYALCETASETAAKVISISGFDSYKDGQLVIVQFRYEVVSGNVTLNINSLGAKPIYFINGSNNVSVPSGVIQAWANVILLYKGGAFYILYVARRQPIYNTLVSDVAAGSTSCTFSNVYGFSESSNSNNIVNVFSNKFDVRIKSIVPGNNSLTLNFTKPLKEASRMMVKITYS